ncbi:MAG: hypothetical protein HY923_01480 [Elusimicrobia bacterium]|nr:hypothetical protein [Elusimicrobiota bacterium]
MSVEETAESELLKIIENGVSASADRLAKLSRTSWLTQTTSIAADSLEKFTVSITEDAKEHYGAYLSMPGAVFLLMFPKQGSDRLARLFLPKGEVVDAARLEDALAEIANIVVHAVANALADACGEAFFLTAPSMTSGSKGALLKAAPERIPGGAKKFAIMAFVHMSAETLSSDCTMVLLFDATCRRRLLKALEG